jgi:protein-S-isoprenylcysteine O-methyltransferase Ste14
MEEIYYKIIFGILFLIFMMIRIPHGKIWKKQKKVKSEGNNREKILVWIVSIGMMLIPLIWLFSGLFNGFNIGLQDWARYLGITIAIFSLWLFYTVHKTLGKNWSPVLEIRENHTLIKEGPYKRIRHPMYTQIWLWVIAQFLLSSNWIVGLVGVITWSILYFIRVPKEEELMLKQFGDEYRKYIKETGRIFPKF